MKWKCLVVDDERLGRELIVDFIDKVPDLELVGECNTAMAVNQHLIKGGVDILFLDIQMPGITGIEFLKTIRFNSNIKTILTTGYSEFAVESYELGVVDYLLKPIEFERFYMAVNKIIHLDLIPIEASATNKDGQYLFLKSGSEIIKVRFVEIVLINAKGSYVEIVSDKNEKTAKFLFLYSMNRFMHLLPNNFYRIHRSHIVNIDFIRKVSGNTIHLTNAQVVVSRYKKEDFLRYLGDNYMG